MPQGSQPSLLEPSRVTANAPDAVLGTRPALPTWVSLIFPRWIQMSLFREIWCLCYKPRSSQTKWVLNYVYKPALAGQCLYRSTFSRAVPVLELEVSQPNRGKRWRLRTFIVPPAQQEELSQHSFTPNSGAAGGFYGSVPTCSWRVTVPLPKCHVHSRAAARCMLGGDTVPRARRGDGPSVSTCPPATCPWGSAEREVLLPDTR